MVLKLKLNNLILKRSKKNMFPEEDFDADEIIREPGDPEEYPEDLNDILDIPDEEELN